MPRLTKPLAVAVYLCITYTAGANDGAPATREGEGQPDGQTASREHTVAGTHCTPYRESRYPSWGRHPLPAPPLRHPALHARGACYAATSGAATGAQARRRGPHGVAGTHALTGRKKHSTAERLPFRSAAVLGICIGGTVKLWPQLAGSADRVRGAEGRASKRREGPIE